MEKRKSMMYCQVQPPFLHNDCAPIPLSSFAESESQRCFNVTSHSERRKLPKIPEFCPSVPRVSIMLWFLPTSSSGSKLQNGPWQIMLTSTKAALVLFFFCETRNEIFFCFFEIRLMGWILYLMEIWLKMSWFYCIKIIQIKNDNFTSKNSS